MLDNVNLLSAIIIAWILVLPIYIAIAFHKIIDWEYYTKWERLQLHTDVEWKTISLKCSQLFLSGRYLVCGVSERKVFLKDTVSLTRIGKFYVIEFIDDSKTLNVYYRGILTSSQKYKLDVISLVNFFAL